MKLFKHKFLFILIILIILFYLFCIDKKIFIKYQNENCSKYNLTEILFETSVKSENFVYNANYGILTEKIPTTNIENPNISVVIPMFNTENFVRRSILSIQNQNISNFEIIIINDCSTDKSFNIVHNLSLKDKRIKIINNTKNMGLLYSRCIGTLLSKGKFVFPLDSDDMYLIHDTLFNVYTEVKKNNPDILKFRGISVKSIENFFNKTRLSLFRGNIKQNMLIYQPELANNSYKICSLQALSIKSELYKKIIKLLGKSFLYEHISYNEDCITNYVMNQYAKSGEQFLKIGYLYIYRESSNSHTELHINKIKSKVYYTEAILKYSIIENKNKIFAAKALVSFFKNQNISLFLQDNKIKKHMKWIINKIILERLISIEDKKYDIILMKNIF